MLCVELRLESCYFRLYLLEVCDQMPMPLQGALYISYAAPGHLRPEELNVGKVPDHHVALGGKGLESHLEAQHILLGCFVGFCQLLGHAGHHAGYFPPVLSLELCLLFLLCCEPSRETNAFHGSPLLWRCIPSYEHKLVARLMLRETRCSTGTGASVAHELCFRASATGQL